MSALTHVPATTPPADLADHLRRDGYVIVDDLVPHSLMDSIEEELAPYLDATPMGYNAMIGTKTRRTGALVARSPACRTLIQDPTVLAVCTDFLGHASAFQLMLTQVISIEPGESDQALHRDQNAFDFYPFPDDYHVQCNTLWAMTDYTAEMGATRVVPGSQIGDKKPTDYAADECLQAEMSRGATASGGSGRRKTNSFRYQQKWRGPWMTICSS